MSNSSLVTKSIPALSSNYTTGRSGKVIEKITLHHMAGASSIEQCGGYWQTAGRNGSSHYGVCESNIGQYVDETNTAWCDGNFDSNCRSVTIETSNAPSVTGKDYPETVKKGDDQGWPVSDETLSTLIKLVADIAKRNNLHPLVCGKTLTWHSMYSATACPGPYLMSKMQHITDEANKINAAAESDVPEENAAYYKVIDIPMAGGRILYGVAKQVIALSDKTKAQEYASKLNAQG